MNSGTWETILEDLTERLRCAKCGKQYGRSAMTFLAARSDHNFVRCTCEGCKAEAVAIVIVREIGGGERAREAPPDNGGGV